MSEKDFNGIFDEAQQSDRVKAAMGRISEGYKDLCHALFEVGEETPRLNGGFLVGVVAPKLAMDAEKTGYARYAAKKAEDAGEHSE